ncbi:MAG: hypothetical protein ISQ32_05295 [Rickettsiales bacterium]|nr:hypothetical protein [Rickettsiales bacterium]
MKLLHKLIFKKIVVLLGDNYAKIFVFHKKKVIDNIIIKKISDKDEMKSLIGFFNKYSKLPIYLVLNLSEQSFEPFSIPTKNPFLLSKLLARKLSVNKGEETIKGFYRLTPKGKTKTTECVLISIPILSPLDEWLDFFTKIPNIVRSIYSFPVELQNIDNDIIKLEYIDQGKIESKDKKSKKKPELKHDQNGWCFYVYQSETSGIRFSITKENDLIFTRLLHYNFDSEPFDHESVEGIKNEILGTIEYLKRLDFKEKEGIDIYLFVDDTFQEFFNHDTPQNFVFQCIDLNHFGNYISNDQDAKFQEKPDDLFMNYFVNNGRFDGFVNNNIKLEAKLFEYNLVANIVMVAVLLLTSLFSVIPIYRITSEQQAIKQTRADKNKYAQKLETIREEKFGFDIDEDKVIDVASLHTKLIKATQDPIKMIYEFKKHLPDNIVIAEIDWKEHKNTQMKLVISAFFESEGLSFEQLFSAYDVFLRSIKKGFANYQINHSDLPDTMSFEDTTQILPVNIQIIGPVR